MVRRVLRPRNPVREGFDCEADSMNRDPFDFFNADSVVERNGETRTLGDLAAGVERLIQSGSSSSTINKAVVIPDNGCLIAPPAGDSCQ